MLPWLCIALPLLAALLIAGARGVLRRPFAELLALVTTLVVAVLAFVLAAEVEDAPLVRWAGGWSPSQGVAIGISLVVDGYGAGLVSVVAALAAATVVYALRYWDDAHGAFVVLVLLFVSGMIGFCLTGDLFDMFVFFELMSVAAYALTAHRVEEASPITGAINFAITNSVGAFVLLMGIAFVYARTGALSLAQIGDALARAPPDGLVFVGWLLVLTGFLVKASIVPFHFWLPDAHAVAPTPISVMFSGVMVELGIYAVARVHHVAFARAFGAAGARAGLLLVAIGAATAVVGAGMALVQRHLKRLLAFSTVSHSGILLAGVGLLHAEALAGVAVYLAAHAAVKGCLFMAVGAIHQELGSVDELRLRGRGRDRPGLAVLVAVAALALAGCPPFGTALGKALIDEHATLAGASWLAWVFALASALTGAAMLRAVARIFLGRGPARDELESSGATEEEPPEEPRGPTTLLLMLAPAVVLLASSLAVGLVPAVTRWARAGAHRFVDGEGFAAAVLDAKPWPVLPPSSPHTWSAKSLVVSGATAAAAALLAALSLQGERGRARGVARAAGRVGAALNRLHSGQVGDYVVWLLVGIALYGGALALVSR